MKKFCPPGLNRRALRWRLSLDGQAIKPQRVSVRNGVALGYTVKTEKHRFEIINIISGCFIDSLGQIARPHLGIAAIHKQEQKQGPVIVDIAFHVLDHVMEDGYSPAAALASIELEGKTFFDDYLCKHVLQLYHKGRFPLPDE